MSSDTPKPIKPGDALDPDQAPGVVHHCTTTGMRTLFSSISTLFNARPTYPLQGEELKLNERGELQEGPFRLEFIPDDQRQRALLIALNQVIAETFTTSQPAARALLSDLMFGFQTAMYRKLHRDAGKIGTPYTEDTVTINNDGTGGLEFLQGDQLIRLSPGKRLAFENALTNVNAVLRAGQLLAQQEQASTETAAAQPPEGGESAAAPAGL